MNGYAGKILLINLSESQVSTMSTSLYLREYLGGRGIGIKILNDLIDPKRDPLGPENPLIFMTGPLTGTLAPSSGRVDVVTISPESNLLAGANSGGFWGPELKWAGYDGMVIVGRAEYPVYIEIYNDEVSIKTADKLWGKDVFETVKILKQDDDRNQVACIGPAGENKNYLAGIAFNYRNYAARAGVGAVMGAKNLKAIVVRGTRGLDVFDPKSLEETALEIQKREKTMPLYKDAPSWHWKLFESLEEDGKAFFGNYEPFLWADRNKAVKNLREFIEQNYLKPESCFACPLRCWAYFSVKGEEGAPIIACQGTWASIAYFMKLSDPYYIWKIYTLCQKLGLDASATSAVIAFAQDLYKRGIISIEETKGLSLEPGNGEALARAIEKIAKREDFGNILAEGIKKAAQIIGPEAEKYAVYSKGGTELWLMEVRPFKGVALSCAVTDSGSCNRATYAFPDFYYRSMKKQAEMIAKNLTGKEESANPKLYEQKPRMVIFYENLHIIADSLGVCAIPFQPVGWELWSRALFACTGIRLQADEVSLIADRIRTMERLINLRQGLTKENDTLSERLFKENIEEGPWKGEVLDKEKFEAMKEEYYFLRGWDKDGRPTEKTLEKLGLK
jgi:aldehyde:ferredoxin oxidoreductase